MGVCTSVIDQVLFYLSKFTAHRSANTLLITAIDRIKIANVASLADVMEDVSASIINHCISGVIPFDVSTVNFV